MKPILDWYSLLPEPIRSQAIENIHHNFIDGTETLSDAILLGLRWGHKMEEQEYWNSIYNRALSGEFDKHD